MARKTVADKLRERDGASQRNGKPAGPPSALAPTNEPWELPVPLDNDHHLPAFPTDALPSWLSAWVTAEAEATQTPPDLPAMLALAVAGAAIAKHVRVLIRRGWSEPTNLFVAVALPPGDRKSAVFADAIVPVQVYEREELERMAPIIAEMTSDHRAMEARLKATELKAAKAKAADVPALRDEARQLARELAAHIIPDPPQMYCDDVTPEKLAQLLARQGGRILQASPEGTAIEIAKGRYSDVANFDVYLKGHAGDPLRVGRVSRKDDIVDQPALSLALAVQPDVIRCLADQISMRGRGYLARWYYSLPVSRVGTRKIKPQPVPADLASDYLDGMLALWRIAGTVDEHGKPAPHLLHFAADADLAMAHFEHWLEPKLAEGEELSYLAGWASKLAGAIARIAGILHMAEAVGTGASWQTPITEATVAAAIRIGRDYLLPHALAAFSLMGADETTEDARQVWGSICRQSEDSEYSENAPLLLSRRDIHQWNRRRFKTAELLDPAMDLLVKEGYLRPVAESGQAGRGHKSPSYRVNPLALAASQKEAPRTHRTQRTHTVPPVANGEDSECSEYALGSPQASSEDSSIAPKTGQGVNDAMEREDFLEV